MSSSGGGSFKKHIWERGVTIRGTKKEDSTYIQPDSMEIGPAGEKMGQARPDQAMVSTPSKVKNVPMTWERVFTWGTP